MLGRRSRAPCHSGTRTPKCGREDSRRFDCLPQSWTPFIASPRPTLPTFSSLHRLPPPPPTFHHSPVLRPSHGQGNVCPVQPNKVSLTGPLTPSSATASSTISLMSPLMLPKPTSRRHIAKSPYPALPSQTRTYVLTRDVLGRYASIQTRAETQNCSRK